jgi:hypothetical protein
MLTEKSFASVNLSTVEYSLKRQKIKDYQKYYL